MLDIRFTACIQYIGFKSYPALSFRLRSRRNVRSCFRIAANTLCYLKYDDFTGDGTVTKADFYKFWHEVSIHYQCIMFCSVKTTNGITGCIVYRCWKLPSIHLSERYSIN